MRFLPWKAGQLGLSFVMLPILGGCSMMRGPVLSPQGPIGVEQRNLLFLVCALMSIVLVTVWGLTLYVVTQFRAAHPKKAYRPDWLKSKTVGLCCLGGPVLIILIFAFFLVRSTYALDPYKTLTSDNPVSRLGPGNAVDQPVQIQVISADWKWIFFYPDSGIATVNEVVVPVGTPLQFKLTTTGPMSSFMVQGLGGQIYAMAGMVTWMNLRADKEGVYTGRNMQFTGANFPHHYFNVRTVSARDYKNWVAQTLKTQPPLDAAEFETIIQPDKKDRFYPVHYFSSYPAEIFQAVVDKYRPWPASGAAMPAQGAETAMDMNMRHEHDSPHTQ